MSARSSTRPVLPSSRYLAEGIGTFCLVFAGTGAVIVDQASGGKIGVLGIALVFGLVVVAMIYAIGRVSGAHMNPAVTLAFWAEGKHPTREVLPYAAAQLAGASAASALLRVLFPLSQSLGATMPAGSDLQSFALELVMTFILMFTIMGVATDDRAEGAMAGIAVGGVIALDAAFGGPVSGASMNPARSFGPALVTWRFAHHWLYWAGPVLGALLGARAYRLVRRGRERVA